MRELVKNNQIFKNVSHFILFCTILICLSIQKIDGGYNESDFHYYMDGKKFPLTLSKELIAIRFKPGVTMEVKKSIIDSENITVDQFSKKKELPAYNVTLFPLRSNLKQNSIIQTINMLNLKTEIRLTRDAPYFIALKQLRVFK